MAEQKLESLVARLEAAVSRLEGGGGTTAAPATSGADGGGSEAASVTAFDTLLNTALARLVTAAKTVGGEVLNATSLLESAFKAERTVILAISQCKKPDVAGLQTLLAPVGEAMGRASALTEGKRTDAFNQVKAVAESLQALSFVAYQGKDMGMSLPGPHVEEAWGAAEFYNNKALVQYRNVDANQVEWCKALKELFLPALKDYVKQYHTTGPAWNPSGIDVSQFSAGAPPSATAAAGPPAPPAGGPPPPPKGGPPPPPKAPPPPPAFGPPSTAAPAKEGASMSAVFAAINQGDNVTKGLKKVTDDMKTKNRADRTGAVPASTGRTEAASTTTKAPAAGPAPKVLKPVFELQLDRKWVIENQVDNRELIITETTAKQTVYIYGCKNSVVQVKGKVNNITMDGCKKCALVFNDVVAACEVVNCNGVEVQCLGVVPTVAIDNTSGCKVVLSKDSLAAAITTAKSSEINIGTPGEGEDFVETPLPEQFISEFKNGKWITNPVQHSGA